MQAAITLRLARGTDAPAVALLSRDEVEAGLAWSFTPARVRRCLREPATNVLVACAEDRLLGVGIMSYTLEHAHLELLGVIPAARGHGLGRQMLEWLERPAVVGGASSVWLEVRASNTRAQSFYRHLGYQPVATLPRYYDGREDAIRMGRELSAAEPLHRAVR